jgi:G6PDH family F420-dependent oxidoreductase
MAEVGLFLSSEEHGPRTLVTQAQMAEEAGFHSLFISDHYHPWIGRQGESPFIWSVIGAIAATTSQRVMTGVTCPIMRIHPAVIAQATATSQLLLNGRFVFGVGTGEALNEHIAGEKWPTPDVRLEMLEEAVGVIRDLWRGQIVNHRGRHFTVENARIYSCPDEPPPIRVSAFGPKALELAARIGDGFVTTRPDAEVVAEYRSKGGKGPTVAAMKVCWDADEHNARKLAFELWPTEGLSGQLSQELPMPAHFEQAASVVTEDMVAEKVPCGPDPERHLAAIRHYLEAGYDELYVSQIGPDLGGFLNFYNSEIRPRLGA